MWSTWMSGPISAGSASPQMPQRPDCASIRCLTCSCLRASRRRWALRFSGLSVFGVVGVPFASPASMVAPKSVPVRGFGSTNPACFKEVSPVVRVVCVPLATAGVRLFLVWLGPKKPSSVDGCAVGTAAGVAVPAADVDIAVRAEARRPLFLGQPPNLTGVRCRQSPLATAAAQCVRPLVRQVR